MLVSIRLCAPWVSFLYAFCKNGVMAVVLAENYILMPSTSVDEVKNWHMNYHVKSIINK